MILSDVTIIILLNFIIYVYVQIFFI